MESFIYIIHKKKEKTFFKKGGEEKKVMEKNIDFWVCLKRVINFHKA